MNLSLDFQMEKLFLRRRTAQRPERLCVLRTITTITSNWVRNYREKGYTNLPIQSQPNRPPKKSRKSALEEAPVETDVPFQDTDDFPEIYEEPSKDFELHGDHHKSKPLARDIEDSHKHRQLDQDVGASEDADLLVKDIEGAPSNNNGESLHNAKLLDKGNEGIRDKDKAKQMEKEAGKLAGPRIESLNENDDKRSDKRPTNSLVREFLDLTDTAGEPEDHNTFVKPQTKIEPYYIDIKTPATPFVTGNDMEKTLGEVGSPVAGHEHTRSSSETPVHDGTKENDVSQMTHEKTADSPVEKPLNKESDKPVDSPMSNPLDEEDAGRESKNPLTRDTKENAGSRMTEPLRNDGKEISGSPLKKPLDKGFKEIAGAEQSVQDDFPEYPTANAHAVLDKTRQEKSHRNNTKAHPRFFRFLFRRRRYGYSTAVRRRRLFFSRRRRSPIYVSRRRRSLLVSRRRRAVYARRRRLAFSRRRRAVYARRRRRSTYVSRRRRSVSASRRRRQVSPRLQPPPDESGNIRIFLKKFRCNIASMVLTEGCMDKIQRCVRKYNRVAFSKFADMHTIGINYVQAQDEQEIKDDVFVKTEL